MADFSQFTEANLKDLHDIVKANRIFMRPRFYGLALCNRLLCGALASAVILQMMALAQILTPVLAVGAILCVGAASLTSIDFARAQRQKTRSENRCPRRRNVKTGNYCLPAGAAASYGQAEAGPDTPVQTLRRHQGQERPPADRPGAAEDPHEPQDGILKATSKKKMLKSVLSLFSRNSSLQKRSAEELQDLRQKWKNLYAVNLLGIERTLKIALGSIAVASAGIISLFSGTTPFYFLYFAIGAGYLGVGAGKLVSAGIGKYGRGREGQIYEHFKTNLKSEWTAKEEGKKRTTHERRRKFFHAARHQKSITPVQPLPPLRIGKKDP